MIVRTDAVDTQAGSVSPAQQAGLRAGDMILSVDGQTVRSNDQIASLFLESGGKPLRLRVQRESVLFETQLTAAQSVEGKYRAGIWVRDSSAGIGTLTFAVPQYGMFAGLGHAVCDVDTGKRMPLHGGEAVDVHIQGSFKGRGGEPGELCGVFANRSIGTLTDNTESGIYGTYTASPAGELMPVAMYYEVQEGDATILAEVDDEGPREYAVQITKLFKKPDAMQKNLVVKVIDPALIEKTGGIVQGMSGSPILQNGMIVGAVTHVFIQDSLQGFGIYAQTMLREMQRMAEQIAS
jgi:stage IV sporulation protein B